MTPTPQPPCCLLLFVAGRGGMHTCRARYGEPAGYTPAPRLRLVAGAR